jgi:antitoxin component HigA of HigAB toxin-antitoxin module
VRDLVTKGSLSKTESERLELLTVLLEAYENSKYPVEPPDAIDAIQFRMHEKGFKQADLIPYFGTSSRVSEVLSALSTEFLRELARLSWSETGPLLAIEFLEKHGIVVIVEPHLKGTQLDGAALSDDGDPIIGMTLRHDRLDNSWYTLLHEVAHLWRHVGGDEVFLDDLDVTSEDRREAEANRLAREAFIPRIV